jgi:hypothetical protein
MRESLVKAIVHQMYQQDMQVAGDHHDDLCRAYVHGKYPPAKENKRLIPYIWSGTAPGMTSSDELRRVDRKAVERPTIHRWAGIEPRPQPHSQLEPY